MPENSLYDYIMRQSGRERESARQASLAQNQTQLGIYEQYLRDRDSGAPALAQRQFVNAFFHNQPIMPVMPEPRAERVMTEEEQREIVAREARRLGLTEGPTRLERAAQWHRLNNALAPQPAAEQYLSTADQRAVVDREARRALSSAGPAPAPGVDYGGPVPAPPLSTGEDTPSRAGGWNIANMETNIPDNDERVWLVINSVDKEAARKIFRACPEVKIIREKVSRRETTRAMVFKKKKQAIVATAQQPMDCYTSLTQEPSRSFYQAALFELRDAMARRETTPNPVCVSVFEACYASRAFGAPRSLSYAMSELAGTFPTVDIEAAYDALVRVGNSCCSQTFTAQAAFERFMADYFGIRARLVVDF